MIKKLFRLLIVCTAGVFVLWFIAPLAYGVYNIGNLFGLFLCCAVIFRFGFVKTYRRIKERMKVHKFTKLLLRVIQIGASAFVIYAVVVSGFMVYAMSVKPDTNNTAVVLGAQVKPWGPSVLLQQRIDAAREYLESHPNAKAVVTGGQGSDEPMSEGRCMYDSLTSAGIGSNRLYIEDRATNTDQNIRYSLKIIQDNGLNDEIAVVTDSYHQLRARIIAHKADGSIRVSAVNTKQNYIGLSTYPTYFVREWIAIPVEILK